jgi:3D (Asp-Asp-Asp) domain-containing protein
MSDLYKYNLYIKDTRKIILTAYNALPNQTWGDPNITASNKRIKVGYIAISKDLYKKGWTFGKKVYYNGRIYQIEDILPSRSMGIDIFMVEYEDAINFGKRKGIAHLLYERK